jgi:hypothetical protein
VIESTHLSLALEGLPAECVQRFRESGEEAKLAAVLRSVETDVASHAPQPRRKVDSTNSRSLKREGLSSQKTSAALTAAPNSDLTSPTKRQRIAAASDAAHAGAAFDRDMRARIPAELRARLPSRTELDVQILSAVRVPRVYL